MTETKPAGPPSGADEPIAIGQVLRPRGTQGELKVALLCDGPEHFLECIETGAVLAWRESAPARRLPAQSSPGANARHDANQASRDPARDSQPVEIEAVRFHAGHALVKFVGVDSIGDAERFRGCRLGLSLEHLPAPQEGEFYQHELEGLTVAAVDGAILGHVVRVEENPAHDQLIVQPPESDAHPFRVPMAEAFVKQIDLEAQRIEVELPEGFVESQH